MLISLQGIYQMFDVLVDVAVLRKFLKTSDKCYASTKFIIGEENMVHYLEEVPVASLNIFKGY